MIKAIIIEDEEHARLTLKSKLDEYCPDVEILAIADNAETGYQLIQKWAPDLVFLDIAMPGESGFDLLGRLDQLDFEVIFVTGFDNFAIDAINFCAIGYILKPIQTNLLIRTVHNAARRVRERRNNEQLQELLQNLQRPGNASNRIGIPTEDGLEFMPTRDIIRCQGINKMTKIVPREGPELISSYNIGEFVRLLSPYGFYQTHRSHLINLDRVLRYNRDGQVTMEDHSVVPVSKRRRNEFLQRLPRL